MNKSIEEKRDEFAKAYGLDLFPIQNIETTKDFTQDINFARRMTHTKSYQDGFDTGLAIGLEQANAKIKELEAKLEIAVNSLSDIATMKYGNSPTYTIMECMNFMANSALDKIRGER